MTRAMMAVGEVQAHAASTSRKGDVREEEDQDEDQEEEEKEAGTPEDRDGEGEEEQKEEQGKKRERRVRDKRARKQSKARRRTVIEDDGEQQQQQQQHDDTLRGSLRVDVHACSALPCSSNVLRPRVRVKFLSRRPAPHLVATAHGDTGARRQQQQQRRQRVTRHKKQRKRPRDHGANSVEEDGLAGGDDMSDTASSRDSSYDSDADAAEDRRQRRQEEPRLQTGRQQHGASKHKHEVAFETREARVDPYSTLGARWEHHLLTGLPLEACLPHQGDVVALFEVVDTPAKPGRSPPQRSHKVWSPYWELAEYFVYVRICVDFLP